MQLRGPKFIYMLALALTTSACRNFERDLEVYCDRGGCEDAGEELDAGAELVITTDPVPARLVAGRCELVRLFVRQPNGEPPPTTPQAEISFPAIEGRAQPSINSTNNCQTPVSTVVIDEGSFSATIFISDELAGSYEQPLQIYYPASNSIVTGSLPIEVTAASPARLSMTSSPDAGRIGACVGPFEVSFLDRFGNRARSGAPTPIALTTDAPSASFFAERTNDTCASPLADGGAFAIDGGMSFYFFDSELGERQVRASSSAFDGGVALAVFTMAEGAPSQVVLRDAPTDVLATSCSAPFTAVFADPFGNFVPLEADKLLTLGATSAGFAFFSDSSCLTAVTTLPLTSGTKTATFYVKSPTANAAETLSVGMQGLTTATHVMTITSAGAPRLSLSSPSPLPFDAGSCNSLTVTALLVDGGAAPVDGFPVTLSAPGDNDAGFFSGDDDSCAGPVISSWSFDAGSNSFEVNYLDRVAGTRPLKVSGPTLVSGALEVAVAAGPIDHLRITNAPAIVEAADCTSLRIEAIDAFGNPTTRHQSVRVRGSTTLTSQSISPLPGCGGPGEAVFGATDAGTTLYWMARQTGALVFTAEAADGGASSASAQVEVVPGDPVFVWVGPQSPPIQASNSCGTSQYFVELFDGFGTATTARATQWINLTIAPVQPTGCATMHAFAGSTCAVQTGAVQVVAGAGRGNFKTAVYSQSSCTYRLTPSGGGLNPLTNDIRVCRTLGAACTNNGDCCSNLCKTLKCQ